MTEVSLFDIARPFLWIAAFAFVLGFASYFAIGGGANQAYAQSPTPVVAHDAGRAI